MSVPASVSDPLTATNEQRTLLEEGAANNSISTPTGDAGDRGKQSRQAAAGAASVLPAKPITPHPAYAIGTSKFAS